jgi:hypothetical protein
VQEDYLHPDLVFSSGRKMQLDVYVPDHQLAFEYQGIQHYSDTYHIGPQWAYSRRDGEKRTSCKENGITLIEIPYWWDHKKESLAATINQLKPNLIQFPISGIPIPVESSIGYPKGKKVY